MRAILLPGLALIAACQPTPSVVAKEAPDAAKQIFWSSLPQSPEACAAVRGTWQQAGLAGSWQCIFQVPDAGKKCSDDSDCLGHCVANGSAPQLLPAVGSCQRDSGGYGCYATVDRGRVSGEVCHD